ncbi:hypothetical protein AB1Y20_002640 [Prymnesium parvum]|uniref:WW domain-containing protein n=1 Tax=Prymnesium parvum TaxID=97485 RepID=A0AB34J9M6_PRYPA
MEAVPKEAAAQALQEVLRSAAEHADGALAARLLAVPRGLKVAIAALCWEDVSLSVSARVLSRLPPAEACASLALHHFFSSADWLAAARTYAATLQLKLQRLSRSAQIREARAWTKLALRVATDPLAAPGTGLPLAELQQAVTDLRFREGEADDLRHVVWQLARVIEAGPKIAAELRAGGEGTTWASQQLAPSWAELNGSMVRELEPNRGEGGSYAELRHYLGVHFDLYREDFIRPVRQIVAAVRTGERPPTSARVWRGATLCEMSVGKPNGILYRLQMPHASQDLVGDDDSVPPPPVASFMNGSLLLLSADDFATGRLAVVTSAMAAAKLADGTVFVQMLADSVNDQKEVAAAAASAALAVQLVEHQGVQISVLEPGIYWGAYSPVLTALQAAAAEPRKLALLDCLLACDGCDSVPDFLRKSGRKAERCRDGVPYNVRPIYNLTDQSEPLMIDDYSRSWPEEGTSLDRWQLDAARALLFHRLALVQGPPGTGKTFVGLIVVRAMLTNAALWTSVAAEPAGGGEAEEKAPADSEARPILVLCQTNHALDQFLEGIYEFEPRVIRVGGRSQSELMQSRNLTKLLDDAKEHRAPSERNSRSQVGGECKRAQAALADALEHFQRVWSHGVVLSGPELLRHNPNVTGALHNELLILDSERMARWMSGRSMQEEARAHATASPASTSAATPRAQGEILEPPHPADAALRAAAIPAAADSNGDAGFRGGYRGAPPPSLPPSPPGGWMGGAPRGVAPAWEASGGVEVMGEWELDDVERAANEKYRELRRLEFLNSMAASQRAKLYHLLRERSKEPSANRLTAALREYRRLNAALASLDEAESLRVLRSAAVVGMTTTGAAKYQALVRKLGCRVIVIEEAAEVLEAHVLASISPDTQQVLLIGDHKQLRPSVACFELTLNYGLDISLFERCLNKKVPFVCLRTQRRMRPAISRLVHPIYPELRDHPSVHGRPSVMTLASNVHFITHSYHEVIDGDLRSPKNDHERLVILYLTGLLLGAGYQQEKITILSAYVGQLLALKASLEASGMSKVLLKTVDAYQGEENDIILLTLVRSNSIGKLGFTAVHNRVCVALSRARIGFYCVCNLEMLAAKNQLWDQLLRNLRRERRCSPLIPLLTPKLHRERVEMWRAERRETGMRKAERSEEEERVRAIVPEGAKAGDNVRIETAHGIFDIQVPEGCVPGDVIDIMRPATLDEQASRHPVEGEAEAEQPDVKAANDAAGGKALDGANEMQPQATDEASNAAAEEAGKQSVDEEVGGKVDAEPGSKAADEETGDQAVDEAPEDKGAAGDEAVAMKPGDEKASASVDEAVEAGEGAGTSAVEEPEHKPADEEMATQTLDEEVRERTTEGEVGKETSASPLESAGGEALAAGSRSEAAVEMASKALDEAESTMLPPSTPVPLLKRHSGSGTQSATLKRTTSREPRSLARTPSVTPGVGAHDEYAAGIERAESPPPPPLPDEEETWDGTLVPRLERLAEGHSDELALCGRPLNCGHVCCRLVHSAGRELDCICRQCDGETFFSQAEVRRWHILKEVLTVYRRQPSAQDSIFPAVAAQAALSGLQPYHPPASHDMMVEMGPACGNQSARHHSGASRSHEAPQASEKRQLPPPWVECFSKSQNRPFFFNPTTQEKRWNMSKTQAQEEAEAAAMEAASRKRPRARPPSPTFNVLE